VTRAVRIVGCGRWAMSDDQAGLLVAESLRRARIADVAVILDEVPGAGMVDESLGEVELLVIVDAGRADERHPAGRFERIEYRPGLLGSPLVSELDTHGLGVAAGLDLAATLGLLPPRVWIYVIFGTSFRRGMECSAAVEAALPDLAQCIERDLAGWVEARSCMS